MIETACFQAKSFTINRAPVPAEWGRERFFGLPSAAASHLGSGLVPKFSQYFDLPDKTAYQDAIQHAGFLKILLGTEFSLEYKHILKSSSKQTKEKSVNRILIDSEYVRSAAILLDVSTTEDLWMMHSIILTNSVLIVA